MKSRADGVDGGGTRVGRHTTDHVEFAAVGEAARVAPLHIGGHSISARRIQLRLPLKGTRGFVGNDGSEDGLVCSSACGAPRIGGVPAGDEDGLGGRRGGGRTKRGPTHHCGVVVEAEQPRVWGATAIDQVDRHVCRAYPR